MKRILVITTIWLFTAGCEYKDLGTPCYHGKIIMSSCCTGSTFIDIQGYPSIGKATQLDGKAYNNVISVPGYLTGTDIYIKLREFDPDKDNSLYPPIICECVIVIGMDVPRYVITALSTVSCPDPNQVSEH